MVDYTIEYLDRGTDRLARHVYPDPGGPLALLLPAMGVPARYYRPFAAHLHGNGLAVVVADLRGTGDSTPPPSLGTARSTVDGMVLVAVGLPYFRAYPGWRRRAWVLQLTQGIAATTVLLGVWPGWGFGGRQARGVILDWAYTARHGRYPAGLEAGLRSVRTPVLAITVDGDAFTPPGTTGHLIGKLVAAPVVREHYTAAQAGGPVDHFRWVRASATLAARVAAFAASRQP